MNQAGIRPIGDQVLIKIEEVEQVTKSGIQLMTDKELDRLELGQTEGTVIAVGPKVFEPGEGFAYNAGD